MLLLGGCASRPGPVPPDAQRLYRSGGRIAYVTQTSGTLYVRDATVGRTIFRHELKRGDLFVLNPEKGAINIGNRVFTPQGLDDDHIYELFYTGVTTPPRQAEEELAARPVRVDPLIAPRDLVVREGPAPLVYLMEYPATVVIRDLTDNVRLASAVAPQGSIVAIGSRAGVRIAGETVLAGPLPEGHRYAIVLEVERENIIRSGVVRPERPGSPRPTPPAAPIGE